jgi:nitroreductase
MREYVAHVRAGLVPLRRAPTADGGDRRSTSTRRSATDPIPFADHLDAAPVLLLLVVDLTKLAVMDNGLDRQSIIGGASVYPFAHNILLAARDVGLGGVMTTMLAREEPAVKALLHIPDPYAIAGLLALGHPSALTRLRRAPVDAFTTVDRFDGPTLG